MSLPVLSSKTNLALDQPALTSAVSSNYRRESEAFNDQEDKTIAILDRVHGRTNHRVIESVKSRESDSIARMESRMNTSHSSEEELVLMPSQPLSTSSMSSPLLSPTSNSPQPTHYYGSTPNSRILVHAPLIPPSSKILPSTSLLEVPASEKERKGGIRELLHYGGIGNNGNDKDNDENDDDDDDNYMLHAKENLLGQARDFDLPYSPERGFRATTFKFCSLSRPHMRAMHASWICTFASFSVQFAMAPLLPQLQASLSLTKQDIWLVRGFSVGLYAVSVIKTSTWYLIQTPCYVISCVYDAHTHRSTTYSQMYGW